MNNNPFNSSIFNLVWSKNFTKNHDSYVLKGVHKIRFYKTRIPWVHANVGRTHTKGVYYEVDDDALQKGNKIALIYDVPAYFKCPKIENLSRVSIKRITQYPGYFIALENFTDLTEYFQKQFSKSSRYKLKKYKKRLEHSFNIHSKMFYGQVEKEEYDKLFDSFRELLKKRFTAKQEYNNNLDEKEWQFYKEVAYPLLLEKKAGLFVVFNGNQPIAITLNYFSSQIIFDAITVFDIDYFKFHLGSINIMYLFEWGLSNDYKILDFSKGYFDYKQRWSTHKYNFEYHILYNSSNINAVLIANLLGNYFKLKQYIRIKNLNMVFNKSRGLFGGKENADVPPNSNSNFVFEELDSQSYTLKEIDKNNPRLIKLLSEFLYLYQEAQKKVVIYRVLEDDTKLVLKGLEVERMVHLPKFV